MPIARQLSTKLVLVAATFLLSSFCYATPILGSYRAYFNYSNSANISIDNISEADALANCMLNLSNHPSPIRCTWNKVVIFNNESTVVTSTPTPIVPPALTVDFEDGSFPTSPPWTNAGWVITSDQAHAHESAYSAQSGPITHSQTSAMQVTVSAATSVSFWREVSSEQDYDYLIFYIDGVEQQRWSGEQSWERVSYFMPPGSHTFKWVYSKDYSNSYGADAAWIDGVEVVSIAQPTSTPTITFTPTPIVTPVHPQTQNVDGGSPQELFGSNVSYIGDINADGFGDYIVGAPYYDIAAATVLKDVGKATVISGKTQQTLFAFFGATAKAYFGSAVAGVGDVDGDGTPDFAVGAYNDNAVVGNVILKGAGSVTVYSGLDGHVLYKKQGDQAKEYYGYSVAGLHDVDGDDNADMAVGVYLADKHNADFTVTKDLGKVDIFTGATGNLYRTFWGEKSGDGFGFSVAYAGDVDHDDYGDLIVGAPFPDTLNKKDSGRASIFSPYRDEHLISINGAGIKSYFGSSVSTAGDVDGDGTDDVIIGAPKYDAPVFDGNSAQVGTLTDAGSAGIYSGATWQLLYQVNGSTAKEYMGTSVTSVGSVEGDNYADVAIGSPGYDIPNIYNSKTIKDAGKIAVYSGATQAMLFVSYGNFTTDNFGSSMSAGNVDQDFIKDIVVGAPRSDIPFKDAGSTSVISGAVP